MGGRARKQDGEKEREGEGEPVHAVWDCITHLFIQNCLYFQPGEYVSYGIIYLTDTWAEILFSTSCASHLRNKERASRVLWYGYSRLVI